MRCSRPGVPGIAQGRASVCGSRLYGQERLVRRGRELDIDRRERTDVRDLPRLGAVREVGVRQEVDGRAIGERHAHRLDRGVEAVARRRRRDHRHRRFGVASEQDHQQVALLGLRRHPGRRAGALHVDDQQRQLERNRQPDRLRLEHDPRSRRRRDAERAAERRAERGTDRGDLVLGLKGAHAECLVARELLEDRGGGRDRVSAEEEVEPGELRRGDQPVGERRVAGDLPVEARREGRRLHLVLHREGLGGLAERVAGMERLQVRRGDLGALGELLLEEALGRLGRPAVEPRHQPKGEHVLRPLGLAGRDALDLLQRADRHRRQLHGMHLVVGERAVLDRVRRVARLLQVAIGERVGVDDQRPALRQVAEVRLQSGRVHRDEHVGTIARSQDVVVGEVQLEPGDARQRAGRCANLGREVGKGREVVPGQRRLGGETPSCQLHPVA